MRALALLSSFTTFALFTRQTIATPDAQPLSFSPPTSNRYSNNPLFLLSKRQSCPANHTSCSNLGSPGACCPNNTNCARDQAGNVACCPISAYCTGVIRGTPTASATPVSSTAGGGLTLGGSSTSPFTTPAPSYTYPTLPNAVYPFVSIPQTYSEYGSCTNAYSACQSASTACFTSLAGVNGVTISGVVGTQGLTQSGAAGSVPSASASSICSGLYQQGCFGIQSTQCNGLPGAGSQSTGVVQVGKAPPRARCTGGLDYAAAVGVGLVGVMGLV